MRYVLVGLALCLAGCLERPAVPACLNDADCPGGRCVAGACVAVDGGGGDEGRGLDRGTPTPDSTVVDEGRGLDRGMPSPDAARDVSPPAELGVPDAGDMAADTDVGPDEAVDDGIVGPPPECPPGAPRDAGAPMDGGALPDATTPLSDAGCILDDVNEGQFDCAETLVEVARPIGSTQRNIAVAVSAGEGPIAVAWTDPPDECEACDCSIPPSQDPPSPRCMCPHDRCVCTPCPPCEAPQQRLNLACLDRTSLQPIADATWQHTVSIRYFESNVEPTSNVLDLTWHEGIGAFVLSWAHTRWQDYTPEGDDRALGPEVITVGVFDQACRPAGFHHAWQASKAAGSDCCLESTDLVRLRGPRLAILASGDQVGAQTGSSGLCTFAVDLAAVAAAGADTLDQASMSEAICSQNNHQCNGIQKVRTFAADDALWAVFRADTEESACLQRLPLPAVAANCVGTDGGGQILDLDQHFMGSYPEALSIPGDDAGGVVMAWSAQQGGCPRGPEGGRAPIFLQRFTPGRLADDPWVDLPAIPGRARGRVVRLANANFRGILPSLAWDPCRQVYYLTRDRAEGLTLSRVSAELRPEGMYLVADDVHRGRVAVANGDPVVATVGDTGAIEVRRLSCR